MPETLQGSPPAIIPAPRLPSNLQSGNLFSNHWRPFERLIEGCKAKLAIIQMLETLQGKPPCNHSSTRNFLPRAVGRSFLNHCQLLFKGGFTEEQRGKNLLTQVLIIVAMKIAL
ncbi:hypothetical protein ACFYKT_19020 [Cytobacillus sp. FJAT-53684]|uniref:Uncharacterized protein n=1 Tax=Cytobacillus mangrovibacter TaxID=3299024 RepID=A0ABW6K6Q6_9BACI